MPICHGRVGRPGRGVTTATMHAFPVMLRLAGPYACLCIAYHSLWHVERGWRRGGGAGACDRPSTVLPPAPPLAYQRPPCNGLRRASALQQQHEAAFACTARRVSTALLYCCTAAGGAKVLDGLGKELKLGEEQLRPSRTVLYDYGNVSSSTTWWAARAGGWRGAVCWGRRGAKDRPLRKGGAQPSGGDGGGTHGGRGEGHGGAALPGQQWVSHALQRVNVAAKPAACAALADPGGLSSTHSPPPPPPRPAGTPWPAPHHCMTHRDMTHPPCRYTLACIESTKGIKAGERIMQASGGGGGGRG